MPRCHAIADLAVTLAAIGMLPVTDAACVATQIATQTHTPIADSAVGRQAVQRAGFASAQPIDDTRRADSARADPRTPAEIESEFEASMSVLADELRASDGADSAAPSQPPLPPCPCVDPSHDVGVVARDRTPCVPVACAPMIRPLVLACPIELREPFDVRRVVRQQLGRFRYCYQRALIGRGRLEGRIAVRIVIDPDGEVVDARIEDSNLAAPGFEACALRSFRELHFGNARNDEVTIVHFPLTFVLGAD